MVSKISVQMPAGTGSVSVGGQPYTADDRGIVRLDSPEHVAPLVALGGIELDADGNPGSPSALVGSDRFPAEIQTSEGETLQLGEIVSQVHARSGTTPSEWNNLPQSIRDILIGIRIAERTGQIGDVSEQRSEVDRLQAEIDVLNARIAELQGNAGGGGAGTGAPDDVPVFADMTKARINEWLEANGSSKLTSGSHDDFVAAATARHAEIASA